MIRKKKLQLNKNSKILKKLFKMIIQEMKLKFHQYSKTLKIIFKMIIIIKEI